ncbi:hypothetical protein O6H91_03G075300 [Diphasiastrum complanatum]|uniref:Uncharacterized protein n=1 Tax=Diphasiastrum complanatum TaxID=34168 RepID=A0ACC2E862_DIPCM|nr:hypothetical protein O6H91_03G075300 [Diphasiastrum complanatum]
MALQYHPDVCSRARIVECTENFVQAQQAYQMLSDPQLRKEYDYHRIHASSVPQASGIASSSKGRTAKGVNAAIGSCEAQSKYLARRSESTTRLAQAS